LPFSELQLVLNTSGDPLLLGRDPDYLPPLDPDFTENNDENIQKANYCYQLLNSKSKLERDKYIKEHGYMNIDDVRQYFDIECKDVNHTDPDDIVYLDTHINYKIFIVDENIYTREELYKNFAFHELKTQPEAYFEMRIVGEFNIDGRVMLVSKSLLDSTWKFYNPNDLLKLAKEKRKKIISTEDQNIKPIVIASKSKGDVSAIEAFSSMLSIAN
jgi:hypothetical protein